MSYSKIPLIWILSMIIDYDLNRDWWLLLICLFYQMTSFGVENTGRKAEISAVS